MKNNYAYFYSLDGKKITSKSCKTLSDLIKDILKPLEKDGKIRDLEIKEPTFLSRVITVKFSSKNRVVDVNFKHEPEKVRRLLNEAWRNSGKDIALNIEEIHQNDFVCAVWYGGKIATYKNKNISYIIKKLLSMYQKHKIINSFIEVENYESGISLFEIEFPNGEKQSLNFFHNAENLNWFFDFIFHHANDPLNPAFVEAN